MRTVPTPGTIGFERIADKGDVHHAVDKVLVIADGDQMTITNVIGEDLADHTRPDPGITSVGNGRRP